MATYTSHYNLKKPATSDKIRIADFNGNADTIDTTMYDNASLIAQLKSDIGIVENTNTATHNISEGQYVIWKGSLYTASSAISSGATLSTANLTAVSNGGLNALNSKITPTDKTITPATGYTWNNTTFTKVGRICFLTVNGAQGPASSGWTTVATVPSDCLPRSPYAFAIIVDDADSSPKEMRIQQDGSLQIWNVTQSHLYWGEFIWVSQA